MLRLIEGAEDCSDDHAENASQRGAHLAALSLTGELPFAAFRNRPECGCVAARLGRLGSDDRPEPAAKDQSPRHSGEWMSVEAGAHLELSDGPERDGRRISVGVHANARVAAELH